MSHDAGAVDYLVGILAHYPVIARQVRLAFSTVKQQGIQFFLGAQGQFYR